MRTPFLLTVLASAVALVGCSANPTELKLNPPQSQYDDRMQDSLGGQRYTEAQIIYNRQLNEFEGRVQELEDKRRQLEAALAAGAYENDVSPGAPSSSESGRIEEFQAATHAAQSRVAEEAASAVTRQALIQNQRDREILEVELRASRLLSETESEFIRNSALNSAQAQTQQNKLAVDAHIKAAQQAADIEAANGLATQRIADIEAASAREISRTESQIRQAISDKKNSDALSRSSAAQEAARIHSTESRAMEETRFAMALANVDAERRAAGDVAAQESAIMSLRTETLGLLAPLQLELEQRHQQVAELNRQIAGIDAKVAEVTAQREVILAAQESRLAELRAEQLRLSELSAKLKSAPVAATPVIELAGTSAELDRFIAAKEAELALAKSDVMTRQSSQISDVRAQLATELLRIKQGSLAPPSPQLISSTVSLDAPALLAKSRQEARIKAELAQSINEIRTKARTQLASAASQHEMTKASVVAPVVTGRGVYAGNYGAKPAPYVVANPSPPSAAVVAKPTPAKASKPVVVAKVTPAKRDSAKVRAVPTQPALHVVTSFEPKLRKSSPTPGLADIGSVVLSSQVSSGGSTVQPIVVSPKTRTVYNVVYVYKDKGSYEQFQAYLRAYGVNDFEAVHAAKKGEFLIYAGRYYDAESAARRVGFLNKTTSTSHSQVQTTEVAL